MRCSFVLYLAFSLLVCVQALEQESILRSFYDALDGPSWIGFATWQSNTTSVCTWAGIMCTGGRVTSISVESANLAGTFPPGLGALSSLRVLTLKSPKLIGTIPPDLFDNINLTRLDLGSSSISSPLPVEMTRVPLTYLDLSATRMSIPLPDWIGNITTLSFIDFSYSNISGPLPPSFYNLVNLRTIRLVSNPAVMGTISPSIGNFRSLVVWLQSSSGLSGTIPPQIGNITTLQHLDLSFNRLNGPLPSSLGNCINLVYLFLGQNGGFNGPLPDSFGNLVQLEILNLIGGFLSGPIPSSWLSLSKMRTLQLANNDMEGTIPEALGSLTNLSTLLLNNNRFTGSIPSTLGDLKDLQVLWLSYNRLSGSVPGTLMTNLPFLGQVDFSFNALSGTISPLWGTHSSLGTLVLHNNNFTGTLPPILFMMRSLYLLDFSYNRLTGTLPLINSTSGISYLRVSGNMLSGPIPESYNRLAERNLRDNYLCPPYPSWCDARSLCLPQDCGGTTSTLAQAVSTSTSTFSVATSTAYDTATTSALQSATSTSAHHTVTSSSYHSVITSSTAAMSTATGGPIFGPPRNVSLYVDNAYEGKGANVTITTDRSTRINYVTVGGIQILKLDFSPGFTSATNVSVRVLFHDKMTLNEGKDAPVVYSPVADIKIFTPQGTMVSILHSSVTITLPLSRIVADLCLAYIDDKSDAWRCEDSLLIFRPYADPSSTYPYLAQGVTSHFTTFAIRLDPSVAVSDSQPPSTQLTADQVDAATVAGATVGGIVGCIIVVVIVVFFFKKRTGTPLLENTAEISIGDQDL